MAVLEPLKIRFTNLENDIECECPLFPKNLEKGKRKVILEKIIFIEKTDFREIDHPDFFGLAPGKETGLKYAGVIKCDKVIKNENGEIVELECTYSSEVKKTKGRLHWISPKDAVKATCNMYDYLFKADIIPQDNILAEINENSLIVLGSCLVHKSICNKDLNHLDRFQFERKGFFVVDFDTNVSTNRYVFNLIVA